MDKLMKDRIRLIRGMERAVPLIAEPDRRHLQAIITMVREDKEQQFLSYSQEDPFKLSYASKPELRLDNQRRSRTTLGRYVIRQLKLEGIGSLALQTLQRLVFKELVKDSVEDLIEIISGPEVMHAYEDEVGGSSCMTGDCARYVEMYVDNPGKVKMVLYRMSRFTAKKQGDPGYCCVKCHGPSRARALLWVTDEGTTYMDRIYPNDGEHIIPMREWATSRGYLHRPHDGMPDECTAVIQQRLHVTVSEPDEFYPYMDTFCWADRTEPGQIRLSSWPREDGVGWAMFSTCGRTSSYENGTQCSRCEERVGEHNECWIDEACYCSGCYDEVTVSCERCEEIVHCDNTYRVRGGVGDNRNPFWEYWCTFCSENNALRCQCCNQRRDTEGEWFEVHASLPYLERWCRICLTASGHCCPDCHRFFCGSEVTECTDGEFRCEDCSDHCGTCEVYYEEGDINDKGNCKNCETKTA